MQTKRLANVNGLGSGWTMKLFEAVHDWKRGLEGQKKLHLKSYCTYPTIIKLDIAITYIKKIQKYIIDTRHRLNSADIYIFHQKLVILVSAKNKKIAL